MKAEFDKFNKEKLEPIEKFISLESLLVIYAVLIKAKPDQSMSDVINMILFMAKASKEQPNETLALCKYTFPRGNKGGHMMTHIRVQHSNLFSGMLCLCLKALLPKIFDSNNPVSNQFALTPYELIARRFPKVK